MQIVSWNVNGLNACVKKKGFETVEEMLPDVICCQEIKAKTEPVVIDGYCYYYNPARQEKYSGTLLMSIDEPLEITKGIGNEDFDCEGRVITADMGDFYIVNTYVPNSQRNLERHFSRY